MRVAHGYVAMTAGREGILPAGHYQPGTMMPQLTNHVKQDITGNMVAFRNASGAMQQASLRPQRSAKVFFEYNQYSFMNAWPKSSALLQENEKWIPGGVVSLNRKSEPNICFVKGKGSRVWDLEGNEYIDYQAGFAAAFLGHNDADVNRAVEATLHSDSLLMSAGPTNLEGIFAEMFVKHVPTADSIQITTTGSEATYHAIRIARAVTGRDHVIVMQGGYNGWHNDVACNVISPWQTSAPREPRRIPDRLPVGRHPLQPPGPRACGELQRHRIR